ncbi:hypothetical protein [Cellulophaga lytica]|uniref:Uncharacterized protein n=1 Tax=Cellulophaga lytica (strain ATCC 23178 / DSM 7489 / JCM 8516 / NBRC 14961 / NCIMB 1423 / VKM B-1433 / Cy l20) TaxID=867900 RepID=F0RGV7_CELLC|nr:hypothetical protein [Cellulophaga lytica]ADY30161.1 hypothetical protein Celly_2342 [Cellulophaga lytica DSM 7489]WQG78902.1 hypothetical protein SR888_08230 [Cellulophaga lytica]
MKKITILTVHIILFLLGSTVLAQTIPTPPKPPTTHTSSSSSMSYSKTSSDNQGGNISIAISNTNDSYKFKAKFPEERYVEIVSVLKNELESKKMTKSGSTYSWVSNANGNEVYNVNLNSKKLTMSLDKSIASDALITKFEALGKTLKTVISGNDETKREAEELQREADRLLRDAERMKREAARIQREAKRIEQANLESYKEDAIRIAEEAKRLAEKAAIISVEASHKGAINTPLKMLLRSNKTYLSNTLKNTINYTWPSAQNELITALLKNNMVQSKNNIVFNTDPTGVYINGTKLTNTQINQYKSILKRYNITPDNTFSFYKTDNNIVIINNNAKLTSFLKNLKEKGYINSLKDKLLLEINGTSIIKNGKAVSTKDVAIYNRLLLQNNIIPAPGKIIEITASNAYKLGYTLNNKSHIGTWVMP